MTLTLELPPEVEAALAEDARRKGTTPEELALDNLRREYVIPTQETPAAALTTAERPVSPMAALFAKWAEEDPITGPEDAAARQREGDELMAALQANRMNLEGRTDFRALLGDGEEDKHQGASA
jgi:hypothetical protein